MTDAHSYCMSLAGYFVGTGQGRQVDKEREAYRYNFISSTAGATWAPAPPATGVTATIPERRDWWFIFLPRTFRLRVLSLLESRVWTPDVYDPAWHIPPTLPAV